MLYDNAKMQANGRGSSTQLQRAKGGCPGRAGKFALTSAPVLIVDKSTVDKATIEKSMIVSLH